mgnify:CR=1 FL=1
MHDTISIKQSPKSAPDSLYSQALRASREDGRISIGLLQRRLQVGYATAAHLADRLKRKGVVLS